MDRRSFLGKAAAGAAGSTLAFLPQVSPAVAQPRPLFFPGASGHDEVLAKAKANIPLIRQTTNKIQLLKANGKPLSNTVVQFQQINSDFPFGDNNVGIRRHYEHGTLNSGDANNVFHLVKEVFNTLNCTCYWAEAHWNNLVHVEEEQGKRQLGSFDHSVSWAMAQGMKVKGHPLFWTVPKAIPTWLSKYDYATQWKYVETHVRSMVAAYRGRVNTWDVVNEMLWEPALQNLNNRKWPHIEPIPVIADYVGQVITWAREEDPGATLLINEYGVEAQVMNDIIGTDGKPVTAASQLQRYIALIKELKMRGQAPNAVGLQCHSGPWLYPADQMAFFDQMSEGGLPLHVTEFWAMPDHLKKEGTMLVADDGTFKTIEKKSKKAGKTYSQEEIDNMQAEYAANFLTCAFGHPSVHAFFWWGLLKDAVYWNLGNYTKKPYYEAIKKLITEDWRTPLTRIETNADGVANISGFTGKYLLQYPSANSEQPLAGKYIQLEKQVVPFQRAIILELA